MICASLVVFKSVKKPCMYTFAHKQRNRTLEKRGKGVKPFKFILVRKQGNFAQDDACSSHTPAPGIEKYFYILRNPVLEFASI